MALKVAIIGGSGYTGAEILRLLSGHPQLQVNFISAERHAGQKVVELYPHLNSLTDLVYEKYELGQVKKRAEVCFVCLPHGKSMETVPELVAEGLITVDLSGDFRLPDGESYQKWYGFNHACPELLGRAAYGLPELFAQDIKEAEFIANPGCFPTAVLLAVAPLLSSDVIEPGALVVNALTGVSGAGHKPKLETMYCQVSENMSAYKIGGRHQHIPEMEYYLSQIAGKKIGISFTPYLVPAKRGILASIQAKLKDSYLEEDLWQLYQKYYQNQVFITILRQGIPQTASVTGSNLCQIGLAVDARLGQVTVIAALDNLIKGASGQAIQNANIKLGWPEEMGLLEGSYFP
jgi:N-acetyl-gamma-glutamyl-phosphate reductase